MEDILITKDENGGTAVLTVFSSSSHYGVPVLRIESDDVNGDFGPADLVSNDLYAADIITGWASKDERTEEELAKARVFLSQWPDGPQLWGGKREGAGRKPSGKKNRAIYVTDEEHEKVKKFIQELRK